LLLSVEGFPVQFVLAPHEAHAVSGLEEGRTVTLQGTHEAESTKGVPEHDVYRFVAVASEADPIDRTAGRLMRMGRIVRFNYAKHGERNGVVLDSGDFIHTKPHGMALLGLQIGDKVSAVGEARPLYSGEGVVIEAEEVNGTAL